jgi:hypothetical protein
LASYTWKRILHRRDLLCEGLVWKIGNGSSVKVWEDNWIPRAGLMRPYGLISGSDSVSEVEELLLPYIQGWNEAKLRAVFFETDVEDIRRIPVGRAGSDDYIAWNYTKDGVFSVRSAYHLKMQLYRVRADRPSSSNTYSKHRGWLALWGADLPGKVKIHVWRLVQNALTIGSELER